MKNYNIKIKTIRENTISVLASNKKEALVKVNELLQDTNIQNIEINNITNHYVAFEVINSFLPRREIICEKIFSDSEKDTDNRHDS